MNKTLQNICNLYSTFLNKKNPNNIFSEVFKSDIKIISQNSEKNSTTFLLTVEYFEKTKWIGNQFLAGCMEIEKNIKKINFDQLVSLLAEIKGLDLSIQFSRFFNFSKTENNKNYVDEQILKMFFYDIFLHILKIRQSLSLGIETSKLIDNKLTDEQFVEYLYFIKEASVFDLVKRIEKEIFLKNKISKVDFDFLKFTSCLVKEPHIYEIIEWYSFISYYTTNKLTELNKIRIKIKEEDLSMQNSKRIELLSDELIQNELALRLFMFVSDKNFIKTDTFIFNSINQILKEIQILKEEDIILCFKKSKKN